MRAKMEPIVAMYTPSDSPPSAFQVSGEATYGHLYVNPSSG